MKNLYIFCLISSIVFSEKLIDNISTDFTCNPSSFGGVNAAFVIRLFEHKNSDVLKTKFNEAGINLNEFNVFSTLDIDLINKYCNSHASPYIITQLLSHLSIYKYCLQHNIKNTLIIEDQAQVERNLDSLKQVLNVLKKTHWDILYLDTDYKDLFSGKPVQPILAKFPQSKKKVHSLLSRVFCRYGSVAYVISKSGMRKILNHFKKLQHPLPFDQEILNVPTLRKYCTNIDYITNQHSNGLVDADPNDKFSPPDSRKEGEQFWIDPKFLINPNRLDLIPNFIFAKYFIRNYQTKWHLEIFNHYLERVLNFRNDKFPEYHSSFLSLIQDIIKNGYNEAMPIQVNEHHVPFNSEREIGTCLALNIPVKALSIRNSKNRNLSAQFFKKECNFDQKYLDHMLFEYTKLAKDTYVACLFPKGQDHKEFAISTLNKYGSIISSKDLLLSKSGQLEFIRLVYNGEWWTGSHLDNYKHSRGKALLCFPEDKECVPVTVFIYKASSLENTTKAKEEFRKHCGLGNDVLHINDTHSQTTVITSTIYNKNSMEFINTRSIKRMKSFDSLFAKAKAKIKEHNIDPDTICFSSEAANAAYGKRDLEKLYVLSHDPLPPHFCDTDIVEDTNIISKHGKHVDDIVFHPENHFYYEGYKFSLKN